MSMMQNLLVRNADGAAPLIDDGQWGWWMARSMKKTMIVVLSEDNGANHCGDAYQYVTDDADDCEDDGGDDKTLKLDLSRLK